MVGRLRPADWIALAGALAAFGSLFLRWFSRAQTGWSGLGAPTIAVILLTVATALLLVVQIARGARDALTVPPAVVLALLAPVCLVVTALVTRSRAAGATTATAGAWACLAALLVLSIGVWRSLKDERTDQLSRQVAPPPARPAPPAS